MPYRRLLTPTAAWKEPRRVLGGITAPPCPVPPQRGTVCPLCWPTVTVQFAEAAVTRGAVSPRSELGTAMSPERAAAKFKQLYPDSGNAPVQTLHYELLRGAEAGADLSRGTRSR